jgi:hypothetical protein
LCVAIREKRLSPTHPDMGIALIDRARSEQSNKDVNDFRIDLARGTQILNASLGADHPVTKRALTGIQQTAPKT